MQESRRRALTLQIVGSPRRCSAKHFAQFYVAFLSFKEMKMLAKHMYCYYYRHCYIGHVTVIFYNIDDRHGERPYG